MVKEIPLQNGMFAIVDDEDYERCAEFTWTVYSSKYTEKLYVQSVKKFSLGKFLLKNDNEDLLVVNLNGDSLDFRKVNLKLVNHQDSINRQKGRKNSSSKYKGVSKRKGGNRWVVQIRNNGNLIRVGSFENEDDAAVAYNNAATQYFGELAYLNEIGINNNNDSKLNEQIHKYSTRIKPTSAFRGVSLKRKGIWAASAKGKHIGYFESESEAALAYDENAKALFGDKAILNFPEKLKEVMMEEKK